MLNTAIYNPECDTKTSPLLYNSKAVNAQDCMAKYWFRHHLQIDGKNKPDYLAFGSNFHKLVLDNGIGVPNSIRSSEQWLLHQDYSTSDKALLLQMMEAFYEKWNEQSRTVHAVEQAIKFPLQGFKHFTHWVIKADMFFSDHEGLWAGDVKTTSGFGAATAKYYHNSLQTKTFGYVLKQFFPQLLGTKIFVITKKAIRCEIETIILNNRDYDQAALHMQETAERIEQAENEINFPRSCTSCLNFMGYECPFLPLCMEPKAKLNSTYINDLLTNWYEHADPDEHLELEG